MPPTTPDDNELFRFGEVAFDVAQIFGVTTEQGLTRARRALNRAMIDIAGHDRKWSWLRTKSSLFTIAEVEEYSLEREVRADISHFWMEGATRGKIYRVPTGKLVKAIPDQSGYSGNPSLFDYQGVDSSGCVVVSFFPTPASRLEIFYRFTRQIKPLSEPDKDIRSAWGIPQDMLEVLTQRAAALMVQGVNSERFKEMNASSRMLIDEAYSADQSRTNTTYRASMQGQHDSIADGPVLPPEFSL